jgi:hypothetical protein
MMYVVNGREVELPDDVTDFFAFARECSSDQVVAILGRVATLMINAGFSDAEVKLAVSDVTLQVMALRDPLMVD